MATGGVLVVYVLPQALHNVCVQDICKAEGVAELNDVEEVCLCSSPSSECSSPHWSCPCTPGRDRGEVRDWLRNHHPLKLACLRSEPGMQTEDKEEGFIGCVFLFEDGNIANTSFLGQVSCITILRQDRNVYCKGIGMYL